MSLGNDSGMIFCDFETYTCMIANNIILFADRYHNLYMLLINLKQEKIEYSSRIHIDGPTPECFLIRIREREEVTGKYVTTLAVWGYIVFESVKSNG